MLEMFAPVIITLGIGVAAAILLSAASKLFAVPKNETEEKIRECLPGANCGACGYIGCDDYAAALAKNPDKVSGNLCIPGGASAAQGIGEVLGKDAGAIVPMVARVHCSGTCDATNKSMDYQAITTCAAAKDFFGGPQSCKYGCMGFGDCVKACKFGALEICNGIAHVDTEKCTGCGACAKVCPKGVISLEPKSLRVYVACKSQDIGRITNSLCKAGCIGCKICEKQCHFDAIHVIDGHAVIDQEKCKSCGLCAKNCPKHVIQVVPKQIVVQKPEQ